MQLSVTFRHMEPSEALKDYVREKISRVEKHLDSIMDVQVVLSVEKFRHTADMIITSDNFKLNGQDQTGDMYSAIDAVVDKIERQVVRVKKKSRNRKSNAREESRIVRMNIISDEVEDESSDGPKVIRSEQIFAKPMDLDEAVMQLDLSRELFLVFTDASTETINVLYRREDGNYGLIEPVSE